MNEKEVENQIKNWLRYQGFWVQKVQSGVIQQKYKTGKQRFIHLAEAGTPDLIACINGRFVGIEVKKDEKTVEAWHKKVKNYLKFPIKKPSNARESNQYIQHEKIRKSGGIAIVAGSIDQAEKQLKSLNII